MVFYDQMGSFSNAMKEKKREMYDNKLAVAIHSHTNTTKSHTNTHTKTSTSSDRCVFTFRQRTF